MRPISGNTVGTPTLRTNYNQTNPAKADYLNGKDVLDKNIQDAKDAGVKAAGEAKTAAENAQKTADSKTKKTETVATLTASGWKDLAQTVAVPGVTETNTVLVVSAPGNYVAYADCNVRCTGQGNGTLTFACDEAPDVELTANVLILD